MSEGFDPYKKWLGIRPEERPANHYRLLGIAALEDDPDTIENAADQRMAHVRTFATGRHSELSQKILNEISAAKICLLNAEKKAAYDARLRKTLQSAQPAPQARPQLRTRAAPQAAPRTRAAAPQQHRAEPIEIQTSQPTARTARTPKRPAWQLPVLLGGVALAVVIVGVIVVGSGRDAEPVAQQEPSATDPDKPAVPPGDPPAKPREPEPEQPVMPVEPPAERKPPVPLEQEPSAEEPETPASEEEPPSRFTGPPMDLLKVIDREGKDGEASWHFDETTLVWIPGQYESVPVRHRLPANYSLTMVVERHGDNRLENVFFNVHVDGVPATVNIDGRPGGSRHFTGLNLGGARYDKNETTKQGRFLSQDGPNTIVCSVEGSSIHVTCNGKTVIDWSGEAGQLRQSDFPGDPRHVHLLGWKVPYRVSRLELRVKDDQAATGVLADVESVYLDDLQEREYRVNPAMPFAKHGGSKGIPFRGKALTHALSTGPPEASYSYITYVLGRKFNTFTGTAGILDAREAARSPLVFKILGDGKVLWESDPMQEPGGGQDFRVSIRGVNELNLQVHCRGSAYAAWAVWVNPLVSTAGQIVNGLPVPDDETQQQARQQVEDAFDDDYKRARKPEEKLALADKLLESGTSESGDDAAVRYVLFDEARRLATEAGDAEVAIEAIDQLGRFFAIEPLALKAETLSDISKTTRSPEQLAALVDRLSMLIDEAVTIDRYDTAKELTDAAVAAARKARSGDLVKQFVALGREVEELGKQYESLATARAALEKDPGDANANLAIGKFLCFVKNDWPAGLPLLALGSDPQLKALAVGESSPPTTGEAQAALADSWWELAQSQQGAVQEHAQMRASYWYTKAVTAATGLTRLQAQKQLDQIDAIISKRIAAQLPDGAILVMPFDASSRFERDGEVFFKDFSAQKRVAKLQGSGKIVPGKVGGAVDLNARARSHIDVSGEFPGGNSPRTLAVWIKARGLKNIQNIVNWGSAGGQMFGIRLNPGWSMARGGGTETSDAAPDTEWHHHCLVYDGKQVAYVFDGRLALLKPTGLATLPSPMIIGARTDLGYFFDGLIDDLIIFDRALSEQEVQALYRRGVSGRRLVK